MGVGVFGDMRVCQHFIDCLDLSPVRSMSYRFSRCNTGALLKGLLFRLCLLYFLCFGWLWRFGVQPSTDPLCFRWIVTE